jgi:hypothetical protein
MTVPERATRHGSRETNSGGFLLEEAFELAGTDRVLELSDGFGFDLADVERRIEAIEERLEGH